MLNALTVHERRVLLAILLILVLGAAVKLWRWRSNQTVEPAGESATSAPARIESCGRGGNRAAEPFPA